MKGYRNGNKMLSSSSSSLSRSGHQSDGVTKKSSGLDWSSDKDIFRHKPESDHVSDLEATKCHKCKMCCCHCVKLNALKYHQSFLKNDPPFKYDGKLRASTYKKWCQEICDWIKDGQLGTQHGI